ncbi:GNAT family N-acetyltransferase [Kaistia granuli]|uniref:GNAT family N-acetyltransferase n=1 Tax=Kaistia granuli TaxID=363259 RepID=UPI0003A44BB5|nr:GNAT family N-acetyltransferase [Kaistia granuli]
MMGNWRPMRPDDLAAVETIADRVHEAYPEDPAVFAERLRLWPEGCLVYERDGVPIAYVLSHPGHAFAPPPLNSLLGALPEPPTTYYIHDLALLPETRGQGAGSAVVDLLLDSARRAGCPDVSLVAVNGSTGFWSRHGFRSVDVPELAEKLRSYDDDACYMIRPLD